MNDESVLITKDLSTAVWSARPSIGERSPAGLAWTLHKALKEAERGRNEHGVYWQTNLMVDALRRFCEGMDSWQAEGEE